MCEANFKFPRFITNQKGSAMAEVMGRQLAKKGITDPYDVIKSFLLDRLYYWHVFADENYDPDKKQILKNEVEEKVIYFQKDNIDMFRTRVSTLDDSEDGTNSLDVEGSIFKMTIWILKSDRSRGASFIEVYGKPIVMNFLPMASSGIKNFQTVLLPHYAEELANYEDDEDDDEEREEQEEEQERPKQKITIIPEESFAENEESLVQQFLIVGDYTEKVDNILYSVLPHVYDLFPSIYISTFVKTEKVVEIEWINITDHTGHCSYSIATSVNPKLPVGILYTTCKNQVVSLASLITLSEAIPRRIERSPFNDILFIYPKKHIEIAENLKTGEKMPIKILYLEDNLQFLERMEKTEIGYDVEILFFYKRMIRKRIIYNFGRHHYNVEVTYYDKNGEPLRIYTDNFEGKAKDVFIVDGVRYKGKQIKYCVNKKDYTDFYLIEPVNKYIKHTKIRWVEILSRHLRRGHDTTRIIVDTYVENLGNQEYDILDFANAKKSDLRCSSGLQVMRDYQKGNSIHYYPIYRDPYEIKDRYD